MRPRAAAVAWLILSSRYHAKFRRLRKPRKPSIHAAFKRFGLLIYPLDSVKTLYFYALFGIAMLGTVRFALWAMGILFTLSVLAAYVVPHSSPTLYVLFNQLVLEFFLGGLAACLVLRGHCFRVPGAWGLIVAGITLFVIQFLVGEWDIGRLFTRGIPALLILVGLVSLEVRGRFTSPSWLLRIGDECYSLYLSHSISLALFFKGVVMWGLVRRFRSTCSFHWPCWSRYWAAG